MRCGLMRMFALAAVLTKVPKGAIASRRVDASVLSSANRRTSQRSVLSIMLLTNSIVGSSLIWEVRSEFAVLINPFCTRCLPDVGAFAFNAARSSDGDTARLERSALTVRNPIS